ncbi:MAG TPA: GNAT family N-acetyltransferase [Candidatus Ozemobacteraceae bacterium]|nr:GNAT family N-acetyltransferase [Candidatus Ozemobacteraceae bacterium]
MLQRVEGKRVYLRPFTLEDTEKVFRMSIESGMKQWIPDQVYESVAHAREVLTFLSEQYESPGGPADKPLVFGVCLKSTGELIGHVGLSPLKTDVEVGYAIEECQQGHGYAADAVHTMTAWAMEQYRLPLVLGVVPADNHASIRTLENSGFQFCREVRRRFHGRLTQVRIYELASAAPTKSPRQTRGKSSVEKDKKLVIIGSTRKDEGR